MNTPNKITIARICLIPLVVFFYLATFIPWHTFIAGCIFVVAALTDFFDGYLARKNKQVTDLGKFLDTIADKMLVMSALVLIVAFPVVSGSNGVVAVIRPNWLGIICAILILAREFAISALRQVAASKGQVLAAEQSGKVKATFQFVTLGLYFFYAFYASNYYVSGVRGHTIANTIAAITLLVMLVISTLLTVYSGIEYLVRHRDVFAPKAEPVAQQPVATPVAQPKPAAKTATKPAAKRKPAQKKAPQKPKTTNVDSHGRPVDELIPRALEMFWAKGWASTTMLQKHLGVGYPRASKIVDQMEELGLVSSLDGKTRKVLITKEEYQARANKEK